MHLDDDACLRRFDALTLDPEHFDHRGHLRVAWLQLRRHGTDEACRRVCTGIRALATRFGAPEKFNHTLSEALVRIMATRLKEHEDFDAFLQANPDLVSDCLGVLGHYYSDERLFSRAARKGWVAPDRARLNDNAPEVQ